ncbi:MAG: hypothetical protein VKL39_04840 [Leptolyngbyaceae bacterium]|nr:hypothetical protein [Leptolyngbyaceae bacterium]
MWIIPMAQSTKRALRQNPFTTYREPDTGRWVVVHPSSESEEESRDQGDRAVAEQH